MTAGKLLQAVDMKKAILFSVMCCCVLFFIVSSASSSDADSPTVVQDGLTYTLTESGDSLTAQVTAWDSTVTEVIVKSSVEYEGQTYHTDAIASNLFASKTTLKSITIEPIPGLNLPAGMFQKCTGLETVVLGEGIETIPKNFCQNCSSLTRIEFPNTITSIGDTAFQGCTSLRELQLPAGLTYIGQYAFGGSSTTAAQYVPITTLVIPDSVISVDKFAFQACKELVSVTLGANLESVGGGAFTGAIYSTLHIPSKYSGEVAPLVMSSVSTITVDADNINYCAENNIIYNKEKTLVIKCAPAMTGEVTISVNVGDSAFQGSKLSKIIVTDGVTSIGNSAFSSSEVVEVYLPDSIESMEKNLFSNAGKLQTIHLPSNLVEIPDRFFDGCISLNITIPESVEVIGGSAFRGMSSLTLTELPSKVRIIGANAFYGCPNVSLTHFPESVTSIGNYAFASTGVKSIVVGEVNEVTLGKSPFQGSELEYLSLNKVQMDVEDYSRVVYGVTNLKELRLGPDFGLWSFVDGLAISPDGKTVYGSQAYYCGGETDSVVIPATVTKIDGPMTGVHKVYSADMDSTISFGSNVSFDKNCLTVLELPNVVMGTSTKPSFSSYTKLVHVKFTSIDNVVNNMFKSCSSLVDLSLGCVKLAHSSGVAGTFNQLSGLQMISFPDTLSQCPQLTGLDLYDSNGAKITLTKSTLASKLTENAGLIAGKTFVKTDGKLTEVSSEQVILLKIVGDSRSYEVVTKGESKAIGDALVPEGYTFGGWCTDVNCTVAYNANDALDADVTVYAKLVPIKYVVTIEGDGITILSGDVAIQSGSEIDFGTELTMQLESRRGYSSTVKLDGSILNGDSFKVPAKAFVVSCEWTAIDYRVVCMDSDAEVKSIDGLRLGEVISLPVIQKDGFVGWTVNGMLLGAQYYVFFDDADSNGVIVLSAQFAEVSKTYWNLTVTGGDGKAFWTTTNAIGTYGMITVLPDEFETVKYTVSDNGGYGIISNNCAMVYSVDGNDVTVTVEFKDVGKASEYDVSVAEIASGDKHGFKATVTAKDGYVDSAGKFAISYVYKTWNDTDKVWIYTTSGVTEGVENATVTIPTDKKVSSVTGEFLLDNDSAMLVFGFATFSFKGTSVTGIEEDVTVHSPVIMCVSEIQAVVGKP